MKREVKAPRDPTVQQTEGDVPVFIPLHLRYMFGGPAEIPPAEVNAGQTRSCPEVCFPPPLPSIYLHVMGPSCVCSFGPPL